MKKLICANGKQPDFKIKKVLADENGVVLYLGRYIGFKWWCVVSVDQHDKEQGTFSKHGSMHTNMAYAIEAAKEVAESFKINLK